MKRCCAKCKTPYNCARKACDCHRTPTLADLIMGQPEGAPKPAPANVTPLFQEPK